MTHTRILSWVNKVRREHFGKGPIKRLPRGEPKGEMSCPIHNCFWKRGYGGLVTDDHLISFSKDAIALPRYVLKFINNFDSGKYPELVKK